MSLVLELLLVFASVVGIFALMAIWCFAFLDLCYSEPPTFISRVVPSALAFFTDVVPGVLILFISYAGAEKILTLHMGGAIPQLGITTNALALLAYLALWVLAIWLGIKLGIILKKVHHRRVRASL